MDFFSRPNIDKMVAERDYDGLYRSLEHRSPEIRLRSAQALAEMNDGAGWRFLSDTVRLDGDTETRAAAAAILADLAAGGPADARRAVQPLSDAMQAERARPIHPDADLIAALREALEMIGSPEAREALRQAGFTPLPSSSETESEVDEYDTLYVRPVLPDVDTIQFLSAETHLNNAVALREDEHAERGLVETSLALWSKPDWAYAWYLRGVLLEDLERPAEALLAYQKAIRLDPHLADVRDALDELEETETVPEDLDQVIAQLASRDWRSRRDAAAVAAYLAGRPAQSEPAPVVFSALIELLSDPEREVRHAAIQALASLRNHQAGEHLVQLRETSWLLRFSIIEALSEIGDVNALAHVLRSEMERVQERNPVFTSQRDPLLEVEYDRLLEVGALAFVRAGQIEPLIDMVEGNAWEIDESADEEDEAFDENDFHDSGQDLEEEEIEADEDLASYVDEVSLMTAVALERLAFERISQFDTETLRRLASLPDLTLIDLTEEDQSPSVVYDLTKLRQRAAQEQSKR